MGCGVKRSKLAEVTAERDDLLCQRTETLASVTRVNAQLQELKSEVERLAGVYGTTRDKLDKERKARQDERTKLHAEANALRGVIASLLDTLAPSSVESPWAGAAAWKYTTGLVSEYAKAVAAEKVHP